MANSPNDGRNLLKTLKQHYASTEKPRVLKLYEKLTTIRMSPDEDVTDCLERAERAATGLNAAGENTTDNLIIGMILKGLTDDYKTFVVVHAQMDKTKTLSELKSGATYVCKH
jgi:gag-polypeptide of LTR copia-type